jgi:hypothetical protein
MSASPTVRYTSYGTITPTHRPPSLHSPPQDEGFGETGPGYSPSSDSPGTLHRGLSSRQVQMIAIAGTIGTGLFLGTGRSLAQGGPASMLICYSIVGFIVYVTLLLLGEMATQYPIAGEWLQCISRCVCRAAVLCIYQIPQFLVSCQHIQMYRVDREISLLRIVAFGNLGVDFYVHAPPVEIAYFSEFCLSVFSCLQPPSRSDLFIDTQDPSMPMLPGFSPQLTDSLSRGIIGSMMLSLLPPILLPPNWY